MISAITNTVERAARAVTLHHPNSMDCRLLRKTILRSSNGDIGGLPTLGGMGVLNSEDEPAYEYQHIGEGKLLLISRFDGSQGLDDGSGLASNVRMAEVQIAMHDVLLQVQKGDLVGALLGNGVVIGFEVMGSLGNMSLHPAPLRYVVAARDELHTLRPD